MHQERLQTIAAYSVLRANPSFFDGKWKLEWCAPELREALLSAEPDALGAVLREVAPGVWTFPMLTQEACAEFVNGAPDPHEPSVPLWAGERVRHSEKISPWFGAIARELLHPWWTRLKAGGSVRSVEADGAIHRLAGAHQAMRGDAVTLVRRRGERRRPH